MRIFTDQTNTGRAIFLSAFHLSAGFLATALILSLSQPGAAMAAEKQAAQPATPSDAPLWSYTQFDEPKSAQEPARLRIGLASTKRPLLEARCYLDEKAETIPVTLFTTITSPIAESEIPVTFSRKQYKKTFKGKIVAGDKDGSGPRSIAIKLSIGRKADFWNAMMAMKGLGFSVNNSPAQQIFFVRGSEQRISSFMQNCRSRSVGLNPSSLTDTIISRTYRCKDGLDLRADINLSGVAPKLKMTYKDANEVSLKASVEPDGILYSNRTYKLKMKGTQATLITNGKSMICTGSAKE